MSQYLITCRSLTVAQAEQRALERGGIRAGIVRIPQQLSSAGCSYALSLYKKQEEAAALLRKQNMPVGKIYRHDENGEYTLIE